MYSEQSIESFHQLLNRYDNALSALEGTQKMDTLIQRVTNRTLFPNYKTEHKEDYWS